MPRLALLPLYLAALSAGTYTAFRPTFESGFAALQTDAGDTLLNHYILEHTWKALADPGYRGSLWSPPMFHPEPLTLGYSENLFGVAPLYWALRPVLPAVLAYQWWMILLNALNFVAFAAVARRIGLPVVLAIVGGYVWAFGVVHLEQLRHQQMIARFWIPVAVYYAWRLAAAPSGRSLNRAAGAVFLQTACCINTGWFLALGLAVFVPLLLFFEPGGWRRAAAFARENWRTVTLILGGWGLAFAALGGPYAAANWGVARGYGECLDYLPTVSAWLAGPEGSFWYAAIRPFRAGVGTECTLFPGLAALAAGAVAVVAARRWWNDPAWGDHARLAAAAVVAAAALVLLTLDWSHGFGVSGWWLARLLPGGLAVRVVSRVYVSVHLFLALGGLVGVWMLIEAGLRADWAKAAAYAVAAVGLVVEQTGYDPPAFEKDTFYPRVEECAAAIRGADAAYLPSAWGPIPHTGQLLAMWAGLRANVPVVNGYSGRCPPDYPPDLPVTDDDLRTWLAPRFRGRVAIVEPCDPRNVRYVVIE
jgi:hypothetical protein